MADTPISQLTALGDAPAAGDLYVIVDVSDTNQSANGSTKNVTHAFVFTTPNVTTSLTVTGASASALAVGRQGATTPAFQVDASTPVQVAGLKVTGAATGGTVAVTVIDSGSDASLSIAAKGTGNITLAASVQITGALALTNDFAINTNKFSVTAASGNTVIAGTLGVTGAMTSGTINGQTISAAASLTGTLAVAGAINGQTISATASFTGTVAVASSLTAASLASTGNVLAGAGNAFVFAGRTQFNSASDGVLSILNNAGSDFTRLQFGGTTSSFPALKRSAATLAVRLADDSADATLSCGALNASGALTLGSSFLSSSATGGLGYTTGAGTSQTGVAKAGSTTLNTITGRITTDTTQLNSAGTVVSMTVNNTSVQTNDVIQVVHASGGTAGAYNVWAHSITNGTSFQIGMRNISGGNLSEALTLQFVIIRGASS